MSETPLCFRTTQPNGVVIRNRSVPRGKIWGNNVNLIDRAVYIFPQIAKRFFKKARDKHLNVANAIGYLSQSTWESVGHDGIAMGHTGRGSALIHFQHG